MLFLPRNGVVETVFIFGSLIVVMYSTFRFYIDRKWKEFGAENPQAEALRAKYRAIEQV